MLIGMISDVHGDWESVEKFEQRRLDAQFDLVICAGDLVERGPADEQVVLHFRQNSIPCVQGNHDVNAIRHFELSQSLPEEQEESTLSELSIQYLRELPATNVIPLDHQELLIAHATPQDNGAPVFEDATCERLTKKFKKQLSRLESDILVVGHTHYPFDISFNGKRVLNPGSLCQLQPRDSHTFGVFSTENQEFQVFDVSTGQSVELLKKEF